MKLILIKKELQLVIMIEYSFLKGFWAKEDHRLGNPISVTILANIDPAQG